MKHCRTKPLVLLMLLAAGAVAYYGFRGADSDRVFLGWCLVVVGAIVFALVATAEVAHCPRCRADLGYFHCLGPIELARRMPRYITCRFCGVRIDRWRGGREVE